MSLDRFAVTLDKSSETNGTEGYVVEASADWSNGDWRIDVWRRGDDRARRREHGPDPVVTIRGLSRVEISRLACDLAKRFKDDVLDGLCACPVCDAPRCDGCPEYDHCARAIRRSEVKLEV